MKATRSGQRNSLITGLYLAEECAQKYGKIPLFIFLISFEEYRFVRRAIAFQAVDYLVKLELTPESFSASVSKAPRTGSRQNSRTKNHLCSIPAAFSEYITVERINAAKEMLARGEGPVYGIAEKLGF